MAKDHDYKIDTNIKMSLGIGLAACRQEETYTLGDLLDIVQDAIDSMSKAELEKMIDEEVKEWAHNYIDFGWSEE